MDLKRPGDLVYILGETRVELGGSLACRLQGALGNSVPAPVPEAIETLRAVHRSIAAGRVRACHDLSEGGLAVAAAEMALAGRLGLELDLDDLPRDDDVRRTDQALLSESSGRFLIEVDPDDAAEFETAMSGIPCALLGRVIDDPNLRIRGFSGEWAIECSVDGLVRAWKGESV
jgi:phosphoribosylformylglycinamidine synthase